MTSSDAPTRTVGGRYRLDRSIGSGGMGTVWQGTDELLGREVAVKEVRFPPEIGEAEQAELRERTMREARATARLSHPNVVTTYDVVEEDGRPYIVMELVDARSLGTVLREDGPLPPHRVAEIGLDLLGALETSHQQGVTHRDVKPGNVLITPEGRAVLTDFGIATLSGDPAMTSTGVVLGSPAYMSPERARGHKPGPEGDLWGLGATLYAAVEGRPPYDSENALSTLTAVISEPVPPPAVDGPLSEAILGMLAKDPAQRMTIPASRDLLTAASRDQSTAATAVAPAAAVALDRANRTEVVPPVATGRPADRVVTEERPAPSPSSRPGGLLVAALLIGLLLIGGLLALALTSDEDPTTTAGSDRDQQSSTSASPSEEQSTPEETQESTQEESSPEETQEEQPQEPQDGAPEGFTTYSDDTGFSVAVPQGWTAEQNSATAVDLVDPNGGRFLRIDQTNEPKGDPEEDWKRQEDSVEDELENYQRISIETVDYRDYPAADWEFTFGNQTHVLNRAFVTSDSQAYALYISSSESQWGESRQIFQVAADTFVPAGG